MALLSPDEARAWVVSNCAPHPVVDVPLSDALGCVLAEPVVSSEAVPPFANTAMDGYAVRAVDVTGASASSPVTLKRAAKIPAGEMFAGELCAGECARLFTGAPMPRGADAVVMQEDTSVETITLKRRSGRRRRAPGVIICPGVAK